VCRLKTDPLGMLQVVDALRLRQTLRPILPKELRRNEVGRGRRGRMKDVAGAGTGTSCAVAPITPTKSVKS